MVTFINLRNIYKVKPPKTNTHRKTNTMYHMHTLGASKCMHVVHSVGFGEFYLILARQGKALHHGCWEVVDSLLQSEPSSI